MVNGTTAIIIGIFAVIIGGLIAYLIIKYQNKKMLNQIPKDIKPLEKIERRDDEDERRAKEKRFYKYAGRIIKDIQNEKATAGSEQHEGTIVNSLINRRKGIQESSINQNQRSDSIHRPSNQPTTRSVNGIKDTARKDDGRNKSVNKGNESNRRVNRWKPI